MNRLKRVARQKGVIYKGYYESPLYTVDTKSPLITSVILNQNAVKKDRKKTVFSKCSSDYN